MFAWQMVPNFDYYLWVEVRLQDLNTVKNFLDTKREFVFQSCDLFMYKNIPIVQEMFKEWWYLTSRYNIEDDLAFSRALSQFKL